MTAALVSRCLADLCKSHNGLGREAQLIERCRCECNDWWQCPVNIREPTMTYVAERQCSSVGLLIRYSYNIRTTLHNTVPHLGVPHAVGPVSCAVTSCVLQVLRLPAATLCWRLCRSLLCAAAGEPAE